MKIKNEDYQQQPNSSLNLLKLILKKMSFVQSITIASQCVSSIMNSVQNKLQQNIITQLAERNVAEQMIPLQKQFLNFLESYKTKELIEQQPCPLPIPKDCYSKLNTSIEYRRCINSLNSSICKPSARKVSIPKCRSRNQSITKASVINRQKLQNFIKLNEEIKQTKNQMEDKLRRYYLNNLEIKEKQQIKQKERKIEQDLQNAHKQKLKMQRKQRQITYDFNGKAIEYSPNTKLQSILTLLNKVSNKQSIKKMERKKIESETIKFDTLEINKRRKLSSMKQVDNKSIFEKSIYNTTSSPIFQPIPTNKKKKNSLDLKLSEYRNQSIKYKSIQPNSNNDQPAMHYRLTTTNTLINTIPSKTISRTERKPIRFNIQSKLGRTFNHSRLLSQFTQFSDAIYLNPQLYRQLLS